MRLSQEQISDILGTLKRQLNISFELYLYGSRTKDEQKGGDIDLLILTNSLGVSLFKEKELDILVELKKASSIGQRRIDIKAITSTEMTTVPFFKSIAGELVRLGVG